MLDIERGSGLLLRATDANAFMSVWRGIASEERAFLRGSVPADVTDDGDVSSWDPGGLIGDAVVDAVAPNAESMDGSAECSTWRRLGSGMEETSIEWPRQWDAAARLAEDDVAMEEDRRRWDASCELGLVMLLLSPSARTPAAPALVFGRSARFW